MINTKFESMKLKRELLRSGVAFEFYAPSTNEFGEPETDGKGGGTVLDYRRLANKPQINDVTLVGNLTSEELGLVSETS